jgi:hypothetical protein
VANGRSWRGSRGSTAVLVVDPSRPGTAEGGASAGVDNGREFIAASVVSWLAEQKVKAAFIEIA